MSDLKEWVQPGVIGLLGTLVVGLLGWRVQSKVGADNARERRESRFEENLQKRYEMAMTRNSELRDEIDELKKRLAEAHNRLAVVQMVADNDPKRAVEISKDSAFIDLSRPLRPRETRAERPPSPSDPFQAADPYATPGKKKK